MSSHATIRLRESAATMSAWLKFLGIFSMFIGALCAVTIIGLFVAWVPIWMGILLYQAGDRAAQFENGSSVEALVELIDKLKIYFILYGVVAMVGVAFTVCFVIFFSALLEGPAAELGTFLFD